MVNSLSNHYNLSRDYNQFRKQIPQLNPFSPNNIIKGNKLKLPDSNKSSLHSVEPENSRLQRKNSLQQQANLQRVVIQNGNKLEVYTRRVSQTQNQAKLRSELEAHSSQLVAGQVNGNKVYLNAKKDANPALTENRNNPSQLVEDNSHSLLGIDGRLKFDPGASQVNTNIAPPGGITVDLATNTGIRANFKLDNGSLQFNFSLVRITPTQQVAMVDKIGPGQDGPTVNRTQNTRASRTAEEIHFKGEIISSVDDEGNRVIELKGNITDQGLGALLANNLEGLQMEEGKAEIDINGKLTVTQKTVSEGSKTTYKSTAHAEMELYKVVEQEDQGANLKTLTPLNTTDGFRAGLIADQSALHFNFGVFILGISLVG